MLGLGLFLIFLNLARSEFVDGLGIMGMEGSSWSLSVCCVGFEFTACPRPVTSFVLCCVGLGGVS